MRGYVSIALLKARSVMLARRLWSTCEIDTAVWLRLDFSVIPSLCSFGRRHLCDVNIHLSPICGPTVARIHVGASFACCVLLAYLCDVRSHRRTAAS